MNQNQGQHNQGGQRASRVARTRRAGTEGGEAELASRNTQ
jgi:hypothetical protein